MKLNNQRPKLTRDKNFYFKRNEKAQVILPPLTPVQPLTNELSPSSKQKQDFFASLITVRQKNEQGTPIDLSKKSKPISIPMPAEDAYEWRK